jgi:hypothetical protein
MRAGLLSSPKLAKMAKLLHADRRFREWLTPGGGSDFNGQIASDHALRCVTFALCSVTWSVAREYGKFRETDLYLEGIDLEDLDAMGGVPGVSQAMEAVGWLVVDDAGGIVLPNFSEWNAVLQTNAERQRAYRDRKRACETLKGERVTRVTAEEKRREEKRDVCFSSLNRSEEKHTSARTREKRVQAGDDSEKHLWGKGRIQLDTLKHSWIGITDADRDAWAVAYPALDLRSELAKALEWCLANPTKGRKSNYPRFLVGWLARQQDRGGNYGSTAPPENTELAASIAAAKRAQSA